MESNIVIIRCKSWRRKLVKRMDKAEGEKISNNVVSGEMSGKSSP